MILVLQFAVKFSTVAEAMQFSGLTLGCDKTSEATALRRQIINLKIKKQGVYHFAKIGQKGLCCVGNTDTPVHFAQDMGPF